MRKFYSSLTWLLFFTAETSVLLLLSSVHGQQLDVEPFMKSDPYEMRGIPRDQRERQSFSTLEHQVYPLADQMTRHSSGESVSLNSAHHHRQSRRKSNPQFLKQSEDTAEADFSSLMALHSVPQIDDMDSNVPDSQFPPSVKAPQHNRRHRRRKSRTSSASLKAISADSTLDGPHHQRHVFRSTEKNEQRVHSFGEHRDRNQRSSFPELLLSPEDQSFVSDSDNLQTQEFSDQSDFSPIGKFNPESYSEDHSSRSEQRYGSENHHHLQIGDVFSNRQEQQGSPQHYFQPRRNPHSELQAEELFLRDSDILGGQEISHHSNLPFSVSADSDASSEHQQSSRSELYENEQLMAMPQMEALESDGLSPFPSSREMEQGVIRYPEHSLTNDDADEWPVSATEREDGLRINPDLVKKFPEHPSSSLDSDLEHQDEPQEGHEYPSLDICSEDTHTFYNGAISSSSPLYEIEPFLPQNFNEMFLNELLQKFRPYEHPNVGDRNSVCNHNLKFDDGYHSNIRAMCPFEWEVASFNSSRYPPYLMTARCTCQLSKPMYSEWSACKEKKGQIPVLWRVGCNNGKHIYREGWDEINVACIPEGYTLTRGQKGSQPRTLYHKPSD